MSSRFASVVGAATTARLLLPPDEPLLWASRTSRAYYYEVEGFDPMGERKKGFLRRGLGAVGNVAGDFFGEMLLEGDPGSDKNTPPPPGMFIVGRLDGQAKDLLSARGKPGAALDCLWAWTPRRLVLFRPPENSGESLGKILFDLGKEVTKAVTGTGKKTYGPNTEGQPVVIEKYEIAAEVPRARIAGVAPVQRRPENALRLSFVDGSTLDLLMRDSDPATLEWMAR